MTPEFTTPRQPGTPDVNVCSSLRDIDLDIRSLISRTLGASARSFPQSFTFKSNNRGYVSLNFTCKHSIALNPEDY